MSIVGAAENGGSALGLVLAAFAAAMAVTVAAVLGVLRPSRLGAGRRVPPGRPLMPLAGALFAAVVVSVLTPSLYVHLGLAKPGQPVTPIAERGGPATEPATNPSTGPGMPGIPLSIREVVTINAVVPLLAFAVLLAGDVLIRRHVGQRLGFGPAYVPGGFGWGIAGILLALPLVYCSMGFAEAAYELAGYEHPKEHELLRAMGETPDACVKYLAIVVAVVVAPLWEELLFRGHVQTLIREGLIRLREPPVAGGFPVVGVAEDGRLTPHANLAAANGRAHPVEAWLAVLASSMLFASVHQPWTWPPIFVLSVCLGVAYERTGNLWVPVVMHGSFNALMTAYFLLMGAPN